MKTENNSSLTLLRSLTHEALLNQTQKLIQNERRITLEILHHLREIDRRRAYAKLGYSSLWDYVTKELKYSESAAYRRISAMKAIKDNPELEDKIQIGALSITTVAQVQSFLKTELNQAQRGYSKSETQVIFKKCENKSSREVTRELITVSPLAMKVQKERVLSENRTEISFVVDTPLLNKIHRVRDLSASRLSNPGSYPELVDFMSETTLNKIDPLRKPLKSLKIDSSKSKISQSTQSAQSTTQPTAQPTAQQTHPAQTIIQPKTSPSRYIPSSLRTKIWQEYDGKCAFINPNTGMRCNSTFGLEIEHCKPHSLGGPSLDSKNLRLLCKHHNQWLAIQTYGLSKMEPHLSSSSTR